MLRHGAREAELAATLLEKRGNVWNEKEGFTL